MNRRSSSMEPPATGTGNGRVVAERRKRIGASAASLTNQPSELTSTTFQLGSPRSRYSRSAESRATRKATGKVDAPNTDIVSMVLAASLTLAVDGGLPTASMWAFTRNALKNRDVTEHVTRGPS